MSWVADAYGMDDELFDAMIEATAEAMQNTSGTLSDENGFTTWGPGFIMSAQFGTPPARGDEYGLDDESRAWFASARRANIRLWSLEE